jgi:hypothetical protein
MTPRSSFLSSEFVLSALCILAGFALMFWKDKDELGMALVSIGTGVYGGVRLGTKRAEIQAGANVEIARSMPPPAPPGPLLVANQVQGTPGPVRPAGPG